MTNPIRRFQNMGDSDMFLSRITKGIVFMNFPRQGPGCSRPVVYFIVFLLLPSLALLVSCAGRLEPLPAPSPLPNVRTDHGTALFWTARYPESKRLIMKAEDIDALNERVLASGLGVEDIFKLPGSIMGSYLNDAFLKTRARLEDRNYYDYKNRKLGKSYYDGLFLNVGEAAPAVNVRYGVITRETNARVVPTYDLAKNKGTKGNFDHFQAAQIDAGTPVAVLHRSRDRIWYYVESDCVSGWVLATDLAVSEKPKVQYFAQARPLVITGKSVPFYFDPELRDYAMELDMGSMLPFLLRSDSVYEVVLPCRAPDGSLFFRSGYTSVQSDVSQGFLPYTMENVYVQAFKMLGVPYVWGSKLDGSEDCSGFISSVFRCFGLRIARHSSEQGKTNLTKRVQVSSMGDEEKLEALRKVGGRPVLLYKAGHIMLFLGVAEGRAYAIHSMWSYDEMVNGRERERLVKMVTVTDLDAGQGTKGGSYLHRLVSIMPLD